MGLFLHLGPLRGRGAGVGLLGVVKDWEKEHGELSDVELKAVNRKMLRRQRK